LIYLIDPGFTSRFDACSVPVTLRQRRQWQWVNRFGSPLTSYWTERQRQLPRKMD